MKRSLLLVLVCLGALVACDSATGERALGHVVLPSVAETASGHSYRLRGTLVVSRDVMFAEPRAWVLDARRATISLPTGRHAFHLLGWQVLELDPVRGTETEVAASAISDVLYAGVRANGTIELPFSFAVAGEVVTFDPRVTAPLAVSLGELY